MKLIIKGGTVVDPYNGINAPLDVLVEDSQITKVAKNIRDKNAEVIDVNGKFVCPGFIDIHVHLREPGYEYKEDIASGTRAAAAGGFTTVCCMPNTNPVVDNSAVAVYIRDKARQVGKVNVLPIGCITKGQEGNEITAMGELKEAGCIAVSDDGKPVMNSSVMRNAMNYAKMFELPVLSHCEDLHLSRDGQMHEGFYSTYYGLPGIPAAAEELMVARDILLARLTGAHVHICHISTMGSLNLIRQARQEGINITCEVTPHHLTLTDEAVGSYDADTKVNPPLRSHEHLEALWEGIKDGSIDCIATDHAPHHQESKDCEYTLASNGISGLETAVAVVMDRLVDKGIIDIDRMVQLFTTGPARIMRLEKGTLSPGRPADITVIDPHLKKQVDISQFNSKGRNTPFKGMELKGWPCLTMVNGLIAARDGLIL